MNRSLKFAVSIAVASVSVCWLFMLSMLLVMIAVIVGMMLGAIPHEVSFSKQTADLILVVFGALIVLGVLYLILALSVRCPRCAYKFLKNPKGFGPSGFTYNANCPRLRGVNPWAY